MELAKNIDGKILAAEIRKKVAAELRDLTAAIPGLQPKLCIVQVNEAAVILQLILKVESRLLLILCCVLGAK